MPTFAINPALEAAIVAHADEDTPRLVYADWLDEHGDPDRAAFIRTQCRLADMPPSDPGWFDLRERQWELVARLRTRLDASVGEVADGFYFESLMLEGLDEPFRRGFPHEIDIQITGAEWTAEAMRTATAEVERLLRTTTIRKLEFYEIPPPAFATILAKPAAPLADLSVRANWSNEPPDEDEVRGFYEFLAINPAMRGVRDLSIYGDTYTLGAAELAKATALDAVRALTLQNVHASEQSLNDLTSAAWFRRLQFFRSHLDIGWVAGQVLTELGKLRDLHTLELPNLAAGGVAPLAAGEFQALAALVYGGPVTTPHLQQLAKAKFPVLTAFELRSDDPLKNGGLVELLKADWFERLQSFDLYKSGIGNAGVKALAAHPVARTLRVLKLRDNPFSKGGLAALTKGRFLALTWLEIGWHHKDKSSPDELAVVLAKAQLPRLRYLHLTGWPLGNAGAKALAANPTFANLTRLDLSECKIGDSGAKAIFASPHLQNLVELNLSHNAIKNGAAALADPDTMPYLGDCSLSSNKISKKAIASFARDGLNLD